MAEEGGTADEMPAVKAEAEATLAEAEAEATRAEAEAKTFENAVRAKKTELKYADTLYNEASWNIGPSLRFVLRAKVPRVMRTKDELDRAKAALDRAKAELERAKVAYKNAVNASREPLRKKVLWYLKVLELKTQARISTVLKQTKQDNREGVHAFYGDVRELGWCQAVRDHGRQFATDVGGMLIALYSRKCKRCTFRMMSPYMKDDLVFLAAVMMAGELNLEAYKLPKLATAEKDRLRRIAISAMSLTKTGPKSVKTSTNLVLAFSNAQICNGDSFYLRKQVCIHKSLLEDDDFVAAICAVSSNPDECATLYNVRMI